MLPALGAGKFSYVKYQSGPSLRAFKKKKVGEVVVNDRISLSQPDLAKGWLDLTPLVVTGSNWPVSNQAGSGPLLG